MTKVSALQGEFPMMILHTPSLITNEEDQQIIMLSVPLSLVDITDVFACSIRIRVRLQLRSYASTRCDKKLDKTLISLLCKTKTKT